MTDVVGLGKMRQQVMGYDFYDYTHIITYLEKRAQEGWLVTELGGGWGWSYKQIQPQALHFRISYVPLEDAAVLSGSDWQQAASSKKMRLLYSTKAQPAPLECDAKQEVDALHKQFNRYILLGRLPNLLLLSLFMISQWSWAGLSPFLTTWLTGWIIFLFAGETIFLLTDIRTHHQWYQQAQILAKEGRLPETKDTWRKKNAWLMMIGIATVATIMVCLAVMLGR